MSTIAIEAQGAERSGVHRHQRGWREDVTVRSREARSHCERVACGRLRAHIYVRERGWIPSARLVDGLEVDSDDARSVHFLATRGTEAVGTVRLTLLRDGQPLPVEAMLAEPLASGRVAGEVSRLAVVRAGRGDSTVLMSLVRGLCDAAAERGIDDFYAIVEESLYRHLVGLGFPFRPVGPTRWVYRSWNFPVRTEVARASAAVAGFYSRRDASAGRVSGGVA